VSEGSERLVRLRQAVIASTLALGVLTAACSGSAEKAGGPGSATAIAALDVSSPAFTDAAEIPVAHCMPGVPGGANVSIPLQWAAGPAGTASYAIAIIDEHPVARRWTHWLVVDVPADVSQLRADASGQAMPDGARELVNGFGDTGYGGPQPPPGSGAHTYSISVYALDVPALDVEDRISADAFELALVGHVLAKGTITGVFGR